MSNTIMKLYIKLKKKDKTTEKYVENYQKYSFCNNFSEKNHVLA